MKSICSKR